MAPARTTGTLPQAIQVLLLMRDLKLTTDEIQRLLGQGDLLKLIATVPASEDSALRLRQYASGYIPLVFCYRTNGNIIADGYVWDSHRWYVEVRPGVYIPWLEHYKLEYAFEGEARDLIAQAVRDHWTEYHTWWVRVN